MPTTLTFTSAGTACAGWHFGATDDSLAGPAGRPIVVMAHGFGGTVDSGLVPFAESLAAAGLDVLAFDYRGFGFSDGEPRQLISLTGQAEDYRAALTAAAALPGIDPDRIVLWGVSLSGGTILEVAAGRPDIAALIALTPLVSGPAAARHATAHYKPATSARSGWLGARAKVAARRGRARVTLKLVGEPHEAAVLAVPGMLAEYLDLAGPSWRNEVDASVVVDVATHRPIKYAADIGCPALFQIADHDRLAPPHAAANAAVKAGALVHHYPGDHFDVYAGKPVHHRVTADQVRFLRRVLAPAALKVDA
jgi:pimeloyl-ACP methyl ester carboxylesterase